MKTSTISLSTAALLLTSVLGASTAHAVTATDLRCTRCVKESELKRDSVSRTKIVKGAVNTKKVQNGSLRSIDIRDEAGVAYETEDSARFVDLWNIWSQVQEISLLAPSPGHVTCIASGFFDYDLTFSGAVRGLWFHVEADTGINFFDRALSAVLPGTNSSTAIPMTVVDTFPVVTGLNRFRFYARAETGNQSAIDYHPRSHVCQYFPTDYEAN